MNDAKTTSPISQKISPSEPNSEDLIRQLGQFPIEALEAALLVLRSREAKAK